MCFSAFRGVTGVTCAEKKGGGEEGGGAVGFFPSSPSLLTGSPFRDLADEMNTAFTKKRRTEEVLLTSPPREVDAATKKLRSGEENRLDSFLMKNLHPHWGIYDASYSLRQMPISWGKWMEPYSEWLDNASYAELTPKEFDEWCRIGRKEGHALLPFESLGNFLAFLLEHSDMHYYGTVEAQLIAEAIILKLTSMDYSLEEEGKLDLEDLEKNFRGDEIEDKTFKKRFIAFMKSGFHLVGPSRIANMGMITRDFAKYPPFV